jgi:AraC family transcriptional regulator
METLRVGRDFGLHSSATTFGDTTIVECEYAGGVATPAHRHASAYIGFVLGGAYSEAYPRRTLHVTRGGAAYHPAEERHFTVFEGAGARILRVEVGERLVGRVIPTRLPEEPRILDASVGFFAARLQQELRHRDELSPIVVESLLTELIAALVRSDTRAGGWLERVHEQLRDDFMRDVSLSSLAVSAGVHPTHLARSFRRRYGCSVGEMQRQLRIDYARDLLATTETPQADIALETGFSSQSHFAAAFRRVAGVTPGAYRRAARCDRDRMLRARKTPR